MNRPFKRGDRVVYTGWGAPIEGIGGIVIKVTTNPHPSGVFNSPACYLLVILDTAEQVHDEAAIFQHEEDYVPGIPF